MLVLLMIVILAILALWISNTERKRPAAMVMMGVLSVLLGGRAVALLSDSYSDDFLDAAYGDEQYPSVDPAATGSAGEVAVSAENTTPAAVAVPTESDTPIAASREPHELAVEPTTRIRYLTPRPDWVETEASTIGDDYQVAVESGLYPRKRTAQQTLREEVKTAVDQYVNDYLGSEFASTLTGYSIEEGQTGEARTINLRLDGKSFEIAGDRFDEQVEFDYGVMNQSHALVKFDKNIQQALEQRWSRVRATSRLFQTGLGTGAILLLLGTMFSYLKLDTATRGYYTGRLQFGAAAAILAIVAAGVVFANRIPWM